jgi:hypothetical protein
MNIRTIIIAGLLPAILSINLLPAAISADTFVTQTTLITACGKLFELDSNAAGLTAQQRAKIVQRNLDDALIAAKDRSPSAVRVEIINRNPVVTLDYRHIVTADGNSAVRNSLTQMELAQKWADNIRVCLADASAVDKYIAMLTGNFPKAKVAKLSQDFVAVLNTKMILPINLATPISTINSVVGDKVKAVISNDVPLGPSFDTFIPAGTIALGEIVDPRKYYSDSKYPGGYGFPGKGCLAVEFYGLRTPDGKEIPIEGHILGGVNQWQFISVQPVTAPSVSNGLIVHNDALVNVEVKPAKSTIVGAWKGTRSNFEQMPRLIFDKHQPTLGIGKGEPLLLQLSAPTVVAVNGTSM